MAVSNDFAQMSSACFSRSTHQVSTELQGEVVILNVKNGKYYNLNAVGSHIWKLIEQPASVRSIVDAIENEYEVERRQCEEDVCKILLAMQQSGLAEVAAVGDTAAADTNEAS